MNPAVVLEKWDGVLCTLYNVCFNIKTLIIRPPYVKFNYRLKNKHYGERCFIVMNGPSITSHNLKYLENEIVFCSNFIYKSDVVDIVKPNYYCWADKKLFYNEECIKVIEEIKKKCPQTSFILHRDAYRWFKFRDDIYYSYCRHMGNCYGISINLARNTTNFSTVAFHAVSNALYMGFREIYILGLDFAPGAFKHFANLGIECGDPLKESTKFKVAGNYWNYTKSHYESFYLREYADKHGQKIINLNPDSYIRAFEFGNYEKIFR